ncbi:hypothetical protein LJC27_07590 [Christensenellaceae bacterium OttesenSCG-928-M15]|nr:hypothetical protein [Christensenellaceae bacterium OttesenSCG-928-M15]
MKKIITLALALMMVLAAAAPALAFTEDEYTGDVKTPYELSVMLVDYDEGFVSKHVLSLPEATRGYLNNEIICAVASLYLPKEANLLDDDYVKLTFSGENADLNVTDNMMKISNVNEYVLYSNLPGGYVPWTWGAGGANGNKMEIDFAASFATGEVNDVFSAACLNRAFTANIAFFAKVTGDDARVFAELEKNSTFTAITALEDITEINPLSFGESYNDSASSSPSNPDPTAKGLYYLAGGKNGERSDIKFGANNCTFEYVVAGDYFVLLVHDVHDDFSAYAKSYLFFHYTELSGVYTLNDLLFAVHTDKNYRSKALTLYLYNNSSANPLDYVNFSENYYAFVTDIDYAGNPMFVKPATYLGGNYAPDDQDDSVFLNSNSAADDDLAFYLDLKELYEEDFVNDWGMDYTAIGNVVKKSFFETSLKLDDLYSKAEVNPWQETIRVTR